MDQTFINWLFAIVSGAVGFLLKSVWQAVKDLQDADSRLAEKVSHVEIVVADSYVKKVDFEKVVEALFRKLDKIEEKIDKKADKVTNNA